MTQDQNGVHVDHCCKIHGCKYRDPYCAVVTGHKRQQFLCEQCPPWSATWPTKAGTFWFFGRVTSDEAAEPKLRFVTVYETRTEGGLKMDFLFPEGSLEPSRGAHGFWLEARLPDPPVLELPKPDTKATIKLKPLPKHVRQRKVDSLALTPTEMRIYQLEGGAMTEVPIYGDTNKHKNWMAIVKPNPTAPGGLDRKFLKKARGDYYYMVSDCFTGDVVEFAADYVAYTSGKVTQAREYAVVVEAKPDSISLLPFSDAKSAWAWRRENLRRHDDDEAA
jgi:hypothetical protein